jgi:hypothetical protein
MKPESGALKLASAPQFPCQRSDEVHYIWVESQQRGLIPEATIFVTTASSHSTA